MLSGIADLRRLLADPMPMLPPGISIHRDPYHAEGLRVMVMRDSDRRVTQFVVPHYKKQGWRRTGLFSWKPIEVCDDERIAAELHERGWKAVAALTPQETP